MSSPVPSFGDKVRIRSSPETQARGLAGLIGQVFGITTPSVTNVAVVGGAPNDTALNVSIEGQSEELWFNPDLVEFVDHAAGTEMALDGVSKKWIRTEDGGWREEQVAAKRWWEFWK